MQEQQDMTPQERETEDALQLLRPAAPHIGRDDLLFEAGRRVASRSLWRWRATSLALAISLAAIAILRQSPLQTERIVYVEKYADAPTMTHLQQRPSDDPNLARVFEAGADPPEGSYLALSRAVRDRGLDALDSSPGSRGNVFVDPPTVLELRRQFLDSISNGG